MGSMHFLDFARWNPLHTQSGKLWCPCKKCTNRELRDDYQIKDHLISNGFLPNYHGELPEVVIDGMNVPDKEAPSEGGRIEQMLQYMFAIHHVNNSGDTTNVDDGEDYTEVEWIRKLVQANEQNLWDGCTKFTKLSFIVWLFYIKTISGMAQNHFEMLLDLLRTVIPQGDKNIPKSHYEAKKMVFMLGLNYEKIDACPNDCVLYYKERKELQECPKCGVSRWEKEKCTSNLEIGDKLEERIKTKQVAAKVLQILLNPTQGSRGIAQIQHAHELQGEEKLPVTMVCEEIYREKKTEQTPEAKELKAQYLILKLHKGA